jgi:hypothetical protein
VRLGAGELRRVAAPVHDTSNGRNGISSDASFDFGPRAPRANSVRRPMRGAEHVEDTAGVAGTRDCAARSRLERDAFARRRSFQPQLRERARIVRPSPRAP